MFGDPPTGWEWIFSMVFQTRSGITQLSCRKADSAITYPTANWAQAHTAQEWTLEHPHNSVLHSPEPKATKCSEEKGNVILGSHMVINCNKKNWQLQTVKWLSLTVLSEERNHRMSIYTEFKTTEWTILFSNMCSKTNCKRAGVQIRRGHQCARGDLRSGDPVDTWELSLMCYVA